MTNRIDRGVLQSGRLPSWGRVHRSRMRAVLRHAGPCVLDVGCASGDYVRVLRAQGYRATGLDLWSDARWQQGSNASFVSGTALALPFAGGSFDTVLAFETLEHLDQPDQALAEFHRVAARNVILSVPDCETPEALLRGGLTYAHWRDRTHRNFFDEDSLRTLLESAGYRIERLERIIPVLTDYPVLRSLGVPPRLSFLLARVLGRVPFRSRYGMSLLVVAERIAAQ